MKGGRSDGMVRRRDAGRRSWRYGVERVELDDDDALGIQTMLNKPQAKSEKPEAVR